MAGNILNELLLLVKQQTGLQEKLENQLLKTEKLLELSHKATKSKIQAMTKLLQHLPLEKQKELKKVTQIICQHSEVGMVILFGSYARGDWVEEYEEDGIHFKYQSDFDLLVIVSETCKAHEQKKLYGSIFKNIHNSRIIRTPISILVHDINFINCHLKKAQYFFSDIKKEGITLYDSGKFKLEEPIELDNKQRYQLATDDFNYYFEKAKKFTLGFKLYLNSGDNSEAAFLLHQVTERLYTCVLLVFTRYKPNTHKLDELRKLTNPLDKRLIKIFPLTSQEEIDRFTLLCQAYVEARYNKSYAITKEELIWLSEKVQELIQLTEILCEEKIKSFSY
jgi:predicted nucleotidyltransferase/HEPN domain-containing protein